MKEKYFLKILIILLFPFALAFGQQDTIFASAGVGGSISPNGTVLVSTGTNQSFTITPNLDYVISDVLVDGTSIGAVTSHEFT
ncbi:MAG: hypothetical protein CR986_00755, partial [Ignavibacteriae bacterium]